MTDPMRPGEPAEGEYTDSELPEDAQSATPHRDHDAEAVSAEHDTEALEIDVDEDTGEVEIEEEDEDEVDIVAPDAIIPPTRGFPI